MSRERLYLFDTTLRDGAQTNGVDFTLHDKQIIARMLDELGIDYVEGGYPGANPTDTEFFAEKPKLDHAKFTAFGMTRRPGRSASNDPGLAALIEAKADAICFVAKSSAYQVRVALETTNEENLASIRDSVRAAKTAGREVLLDCEHFFDGYKANPDYALACAKTAYEAGARWVVLCDTNGGTLPHEIEAIVGAVVKAVPGGHVGIHAHNDTEQAVANSLAAVRAGARQIQGTLNGIGERFPKLPVVWMESGLAWIPFLMQRLDHEYMLRPSECPLLKKKPSDYMRDMFYSSQPMEIQDYDAMGTTFRMINAETQLLYSSDYPHWDFDLPSTIWDLPFLSEKAKHNILGGTAARLFKLPPRNEKQRQNLEKFGNLVA